MKRHDLAIIGSGIGGSIIAALNKDKSHILFEKDKNLGGCASTFKKYANYYNAGATTFVGYEDGHIIKSIFDKLDFKPDIVQSKVAIRVVQNKNIIDRTTNFDLFLEDINKIYPNKNNDIFWKKIKNIDEKFWSIKGIYFAKHSLDSYLKSLFTFKDLFLSFGFDIFKNADSFISQILGDISKEYQDFIDAQLLITVQSKSSDVSLLSMALGLSYPFHKVFYANGGMGKLINDMLAGVNIHNKEEVDTIIKKRDEYVLFTKNNEYIVKNVVLNSTIYDSSKLFKDESIKKYYDKFSFSNQSAFVLYLTIDSKEKFLEHYQILLESNIPNAISNSFFISFSKLDDNIMSKNGYSVTISTHTKAKLWKNFSKEEYEEKKLQTQEHIIKHFLEYFDSIKSEQIKRAFSATSQTFNRYIRRQNCGGKAINASSILQTPSCKTPFKGLYNVGDTIFAGQGWPGVALGASILNKELN